MNARLEVKGLKQALDNMNKLKDDVPLAIGRKSLRAAAEIINRSIKAATYSTFTRRTGQIKAGFGVRVGEKLKGTVLNSVIVQYPQANTSGPMLQAARSRAEGRSVAYWWRFLEFGTSNRRAAPTPKFARLGRIARGKRQEKALAKHSAARSLGDLSARPWVRPAFGAAAQTAVEKFRADLKANIETETNNLPK